MPNVTFIEPSGDRRTVQVAANTTLMQAATNNGINGVIAACGGACSCATCMVHVDENWFNRIKPADENEMMMIEFGVDARPTSRLSCQIMLTDDHDGLVVEVPDNLL